MIVPTAKPSNRVRIGDGERPFNGLIEPGFGPYISLLWNTTLKSGHTYLYTYGYYSGYDDMMWYAGMCSQSPPDPLPVSYGGEFFNPIVRPMLISKELIS